MHSKALVFLLFYINLFYSTNIYTQFCNSDQYNSKLEVLNIDFNEYEFRKALISNVEIPVVFHIVFNPNNGVYGNIPDSVVYHQLEALNRDFNCLNSDTNSLTDTLTSIVGNFNISFKLAGLDPDGNPTNGITRTITYQPFFSYVDDFVKQTNNGGIDPWDTQKYLNIWICNLSSGLGYSQFPGGPAQSDGVVISYRVFGNQWYPWFTSSNYTKGRVLVHEIGHWLNLLHPWGNSSGCQSDEVHDTGLQSQPFFPYDNCPDTSFSSCSFSSPEREIVKNFMDYCSDNCRVMFTKGQVQRGKLSLFTHRHQLIGHSHEIINSDNHNNFFSNQFSVLPTISKGNVTLKFNGSSIFKLLNLSIFDLNGRICYNTNLDFSNNSFQLDLNHFSSGMYFIKLLSNNAPIYSTKIFIIK